MTGGGVERVPSPGGACWLCGLAAVAGEKLPGKRHRVRGLCQAHADAVFGTGHPIVRAGQPAIPAGPPDPGCCGMIGIVSEPSDPDDEPDLIWMICTVCGVSLTRVEMRDHGGAQATAWRHPADGQDRGHAAVPGPRSPGQRLGGVCDVCSAPDPVHIWLPGQDTALAEIAPGVWSGSAATPWAACAACSRGIRRQDLGMLLRRWRALTPLPPGVPGRAALDDTVVRGMIGALLESGPRGPWRK